MKVARPPAQPLVIFDGDCNFCRFWVERAKQLGGEPMRYAASQDVGADYPELSAGDFDRAVQLIEKDGTVLEGADAAWRILKTTPRWGWLARLVLALAPLLALSRWAYGVVARNRMFFSRLTRWSWGSDPAPSSYAFSRRLFAHALGVVYFVAFASLAVQVRDLVGPKGIQPAGEVLTAAHGQPGATAYWHLPTVFWAGSGDGMLLTFSILGMLVSVILACGLWPGGCALVLWAIYLSFCSVCAPFLDLAADRLLLEASLPAALLLPWSLFPTWRLTTRLTTLGRWLLWWLLFRFFFEAGIQKCFGGDPAFRGLACMDHYYENQPLPLWTAWWLQQTPLWFHRLEAVATLVIDLLAPLALLLPRRIRHLGGYLMGAQTVLLALTGNYGFLPLLTLALTALLFDDAHWPDGWRVRLLHRARAALHVERVSWANTLLEPLAGLAIFITGVIFLATIVRTVNWPQPVRALFAALEPLRSFNPYGASFAPHGERLELILEGSSNGDTWQSYEFPWKPGNPWRRQPFAWFHEPRLDALFANASRGTAEQNAWVKRLIVALLHGSPAADDRLEWNPWRGQPPALVRVVREEARFTRWGEGAGWWHREPKDSWYGPVSLKKESPNIEKNLSGLIEKKR